MIVYLQCAIPNDMLFLKKFVKHSGVSGFIRFQNYVTHHNYEMGE